MNFAIIGTFQLIASCLSTLGIFFMLGVFFYYKQVYRSPTFRMLIYLSISDLIISISGFIALKGYCEFVFALRMYGFLSSLLWATAIAYVLYETVVKELSEIKSLEKIEKISLMVCFLLPAATPVTYQAMYENFELQNPPICNQSEKVFSTVKFFIPLFGYLMVFFFDVWCIAKCIQKLRFNLPDSVKYDLNDAFYKLIFYPLILLVCFFFPVTLVMVDKGNDTTISGVLEVFFPSIIGFLNAFVYSSNSVIRQELKTSVRRRLSTLTRDRIDRLETSLKQSILVEPVV